MATRPRSGIWPRSSVERLAIRDPIPVLRESAELPCSVQRGKHRRVFERALRFRGLAMSTAGWRRRTSAPSATDRRGKLDPLERARKSCRPARRRISMAMQRHWIKRPLAGLASRGDSSGRSSAVTPTGLDNVGGGPHRSARHQPCINPTGAYAIRSSSNRAVGRLKAAGPLFRWSCCGGGRLTGAARVPSLMASGASS